MLSLLMSLYKFCDLDIQQYDIDNFYIRLLFWVINVFLGSYVYGKALLQVMYNNAVWGVGLSGKYIMGQSRVLYLTWDPTPNTVLYS